MLVVYYSDKGVSFQIERGEGFSFCNFPEALNSWCRAYAKKKPFSLPFIPSLEDLSPFTQLVLKELLNIPYGEVRTYSEVAKAIGRPGSARAVGTACGRNPFPFLIPCHRVVAAKGFGGFSAGLEVKKRLLEHELGTPFASSFAKWRFSHDRDRNS